MVRQKCSGIRRSYLAGVMMESGAAETIADTVVKKFGESKAIIALTLATMIITSIGVFIPVAVLIVAPIALSVGNKMGISKIGLLLALSGGGKAGNDSNLLIVFYVQIMPDDFVMQLHRF